MYDKANTKTEISTMKMAENKSYSDCISAFLPHILAICNQDDLTGKELVKPI
jgi:hypothetical protein